MKKNWIKTAGVFLLALLLGGCFEEEVKDEKPIIYLYPERETKVSVSLDYSGELTATYPSYGDGWEVIAHPDGKLVDVKDQKEYYALFWEGKSHAKWDMSQGFVVAGKDTEKFLEEKLTFLGLSAREQNEFIIYWLPKMQNNPYNLIAFQEKEYTDNAKLNIQPAPETLIRVFMAYRPLNEKIQIPEQNLSKAERKGFTVVEWGGCELK